MNLIEKGLPECHPEVDAGKLVNYRQLYILIAKVKACGVQGVASEIRGATQRQFRLVQALI